MLLEGLLLLEAETECESERSNRENIFPLHARAACGRHADMHDAYALHVYNVRGAPPPYEKMCHCH